ncbi:septum formation initiator family protein [Streptomyces inhibens]|uniref:septum formation initiator family protein n=1 Tax=Streptomyces inhibens TaxID=2293571 RepID=UPI00402AE064
MKGQGRPRARQRRLAALFPSGGTARGTAARTPFVLLIVVLLGSGLITLLLLNSALNQGSFELSKLEKKTDELTDEQQALQQEVDAYSAPGALERRARGLGMVPGGSPAFLLPDGTVRGKPRAATSEGAPLSTSAEPSVLGAVGLTAASAPPAPPVPPVPPVQPPSVEPPVPPDALGPDSTPGAAVTHGNPAPPASAYPPASPVAAGSRASSALIAPAPGSAPAPSPTTFGR